MSESTEVTGEADLSVMSELKDTMKTSQKTQKLFLYKSISSMEEFETKKREVLSYLTFAVKRELESESGSTKTLCKEFFTG